MIADDCIGSKASSIRRRVDRPTPGGSRDRQREELSVPVVSLKEIVDPALEQRYGVPAINILNDLTLEGVLLAAVQERSPLIVQTSVKTVRSIGSRVLYAMWTSMTAGIEVPVSLHLDHCPDRDLSLIHI